MFFIFKRQFLTYNELDFFSSVAFVMKIDVSNLVLFVSMMIYVEKKMQLCCATGQACLASQIRDPLAPTNHRRSCVDIGRSPEQNSIPTRLFPRPNDPISPFSSTNKNPCYTQDLPVSIISNLQIKTCIYETVLYK